MGLRWRKLVDTCYPPADDCACYPPPVDPTYLGQVYSLGCGSSIPPSSVPPSSVPPSSDVPSSSVTPESSSVTPEPCPDSSHTFHVKFTSANALWNNQEFDLPWYVPSSNWRHTDETSMNCTASNLLDYDGIDIELTCLDGVWTIEVTHGAPLTSESTVLTVNSSSPWNITGSIVFEGAGGDCGSNFTINIEVTEAP